MAKPPSGRKRRESSSSSGAAAIKADPEEDEQAATNGKTTTNASGANGLIFKEEVLNRRVQVLFDVDTGKDDEPMAHQWYEGTITAVQLEPANAKAKAGGGGKRGGRRGAKSKSDESSTNGIIKLKATHQVAFDDGDVRWFDLVYWTGKGELKWVGDAPTPVSHPTIDPSAHTGSKTVGTVTEESTAASSQKESADTSTAAPLNAQQDGAAVKTSPLVSPNGKRSAAENNDSSSSSTGESHSPAKKKSKVAAPPQQESLPHTLIYGTKYYIV